MNETVELIIVLADETAACILGGLTQLERLLRGIDRGFASAFVRGAAVPDIIVFWRSRTPCEPRRLRDGFRSIGLRLRHIIDDGPGRSELVRALDGKRVLSLKTNVVWRPDGIRETLSQLSSRAWPVAVTAAPSINPSSSVLGDYFGAVVIVSPGDVSSAPTGVSLWEVLARRFEPVSNSGPPHRGPGVVGILDGPEDIAQVERALFRALGRPSDGWATRLIDRRISTWVSRHLASTRVTPNHMSWFVLALALASAWSLAGGGYWMMLVGTILYKLADIFDGCDGELARVTFTASRLGAWLDTVIDMVANTLFVFALGIGLSRQVEWLADERRWYLWEGIVTAGTMTATVCAVASYTRATSGSADFSSFGASLAGNSPPGSSRERILGVLSQTIRRDSYSWIFVVLALVGRSVWTLHGLALGVAGHVVALAYARLRRTGN